MRLSQKKEMGGSPSFNLGEYERGRGGEMGGCLLAWT